jgi:hypothetical protein
MPLLTKTRSTPNVDTAGALTDSAALIARAVAEADVDVPQYKQVIERLERDLRPREAALEQRRSDLVVGMSRTAAADDISVRARRLLDDNVIPRADRDRDVVLRDLATIVDELRVVRAAIRLQETARDQAHLRWSAAVRRAYAQEHRREVRQIAAAVEALSAATITHAGSIDALQTAGVIFDDTVRPMFFAGESMRLDREWSTATLWRNEVRADGALEPDEGGTNP